MSGPRYGNLVAIVDSQLDAFGRVCVADPSYVFDAQLTYDLQPLLYEPIVSGTGATVTHDAVNRCALMTFAATPTGGSAILQTFEHFRYQPGRSQFVLITFNMLGGAANCLKFAHYGDGTNSLGLELNDFVPRMVIRSGSGAGNQFANQNEWNLDKCDGKGASKISIDFTKAQILVLDFQALYVGRVRLGFDIDGLIIWAHEFLNANVQALPYIQSANLPIRVGMTCTGTVSTTMNFICTSVSSSGGELDIGGYNFAIEGTGTAASGADTHIVSLRPKTTFNSIGHSPEISFAIFPPTDVSAAYRPEVLPSISDMSLSSRVAVRRRNLVERDGAGGDFGGGHGIPGILGTIRCNPSDEIAASNVHTTRCSPTGVGRFAGSVTSTAVVSSSTPSAHPGNP